MPGSGHLLLCIEDGVLAKRSEEQTHQLEAELSSLLDALEAGVILFDPQGRIRFANARFGQLFGLNLMGNQLGRPLPISKASSRLVFAILKRFPCPGGSLRLAKKRPHKTNWN
jgi:nitrogen fixation/metabolism regulation signal transduction histidine kinase